MQCGKVSAKKGEYIAKIQKYGYPTYRPLSLTFYNDPFHHHHHNDNNYHSQPFQHAPDNDGKRLSRQRNNKQDR